MVGGALGAKIDGQGAKGLGAAGIWQREVEKTDWCWTIPEVLEGRTEHQDSLSECDEAGVGLTVRGSGREEIFI